MYRVVICRVGWLRHWASSLGMLRAVIRVFQIVAEHVEMRVQGLGQGLAVVHGHRVTDSVLLHRGCLIAMAQACVGVVPVSSAGVLRCVQLL